MILAVIAAALADPLALRAPGAAPAWSRATAEVEHAGTDAAGAAPVGLGFGLAASGPDLSVAAWLPGGWAVAADADVTGGPVGVSVARGFGTRGPRGFGFDVVLAAGLATPIAQPAALLTLTPAAAMGWRTRRVDATLGLVVPAAVRAAPAPAVTVPVRLEPWLGVHAGPVTVGAGAGLGYVWTSDALGAADVRWMLSVATRR